MSHGVRVAMVKAMDITAPALDGVIDAARRLIPPRPALSETRALVRRVSRLPSVRVELRGDEIAIYSGPGETLVARVGLATGAVTVFVGADAAPRLAAGRPPVRVTRDGVGLDVRDADDREAAEWLIRWRIDLERFGPQWREASP
jgi:hypothetical protein